MMHGTNLYAWTDNGENIVEKVKTPGDNDKGQAFNLYYMSDDVLFFMKTYKPEVIGNKKVKQSKIFMIES